MDELDMCAVPPTWLILLQHSPALLYVDMSDDENYIARTVCGLLWMNVGLTPNSMHIQLVLRVTRTFNKYIPLKVSVNQMIIKSDSIVNTPYLICTGCCIDDKEEGKLRHIK